MPSDAEARVYTVNWVVVVGVKGEVGEGVCAKSGETQGPGGGACRQLGVRVGGGDQVPQGTGLCAGMGVDCCYASC